MIWSMMFTGLCVLVMAVIRFRYHWLLLGGASVMTGCDELALWSFNICYCCLRRAFSRSSWPPISSPTLLKRRPWGQLFFLKIFVGICATFW